MHFRWYQDDHGHGHGHGNGNDDGNDDDDGHDVDILGMSRRCMPKGMTGFSSH